MSEKPLPVWQLQRLVVDLEEAIYSTNVELSVNQLSADDLFTLRKLPNQLWLSLERGNLSAALLDAEEIKHKAEKFAYVVDEQEVVAKANHLLNEIVFASEQEG